MDQFHCMRVFARVVELGSFARASEALEIPRPSATNAVAQLEKQLGVRLLHRTTRQLSLTEDGRVYYEACVRMLGDLAETEEQLSSARRSPRGKLRVSVPNSFIYDVFMRELPEFLARCPQLEVELDISNRAVNLVEEGIDCAVRALAIPDDSTLVARDIAKVRWLTCASPEYLEERGTPGNVADLAGHNCVRFVSPSTGRTLDWQFEKDGRREAHTPNGNLSVNSLEAAGAAAASGVGIAQVPEVLVIPMLQSRRLQPLLLDRAATAPSLKLVYPSNRYLTAKVRAFAEFTAEIYPSAGWWTEIAAMGAPRETAPAKKSPGKP
jgi:LysR family transcriptional regulator for bpeEF and oprC